MTSTPKVIKFITPILAWLISPAPEDENSNSGSWSSDDKVKRLQKRWTILKKAQMR
jgi:hypothetical protein